jgi:cellulose synthase/poly-beta-1,6-N-acetylglucosamine synthase-like glycosyltransferase
MSPEIPPLEEILHSPKIEGVSTARELVRKYLGSSIGNESNTNGLSVDSTDVLYKDQIYPFVIALVPAYNEELRVTETLRSLINQTRPPDVIIVIADNCTDGTAALALAMGVNVVETSKNTDMKAGALNSVIDKILPMLDETDSILVMDADTILSPNFIRSALRALFAPLPKGKKPVGGVGGIFLALPEKWSLASQLQTNEYLRYQRRLGRRRGRALVLTGTGTMFNIRTLRAVVEGRKSGRFPNLGGGGSVYDTAALTEDNELTLCSKRLGYRVLSPKECTVTTAIMPTFRSLYKQRRRWQRGAMENLFAHGINRHTAPYLIRQMLTYTGVTFLVLYTISISVALGSNEPVRWNNPLWLTVFGVFVFEQTITVRKGGWKAICTSLLVLPEIFYNFFLDLVYTVSFEALLYGVPESWGRVRDTVTGKDEGAKKDSSNGKIDRRRSGRGRVIEVAIELTKDLILGFVFSLPFWNPQLAWDLITIFVLVGFVATIGRLIPVKTS